MMSDMDLTFLETINSEIARVDVVKATFLKDTVWWFNEIKEIAIDATGLDNSLMDACFLTDW